MLAEGFHQIKVGRFKQSEGVSLNGTLDLSLILTTLARSGENLFVQGWVTNAEGHIKTLSNPTNYVDGSQKAFESFEMEVIENNDEAKLIEMLGVLFIDLKPSDFENTDHLILKAHIFNKKRNIVEATIAKLRLGDDKNIVIEMLLENTDEKTPLTQVINKSGYTDIQLSASRSDMGWVVTAESTKYDQFILQTNSDTLTTFPVTQSGPVEINSKQAHRTSWLVSHAQFDEVQKQGLVLTTHSELELDGLRKSIQTRRYGSFIVVDMGNCSAKQKQQLENADLYLTDGIRRVILDKNQKTFEWLGTAEGLDQTKNIDIRILIDKTDIPNGVRDTNPIMGVVDTLEPIQ